MLGKFEDLIIRPPRNVPKPEALGPLSSDGWEREEFRLKNGQGRELFGTLLRPRSKDEVSTPCLVYAHANASNRTRALEFRDVLCADMGVALVTFDFLSCGESDPRFGPDGDFISLGFHEADDLCLVLDFVVSRFGRVVLLGRSMGSAAVLVYAARYAGKHPSVVGLIFDGVFESLRHLIKDVAKQSSLLGLIAPLGVPIIRRSILQKAKFDLDDLNLVEMAKSVKIPALFLVAKEDELFPRV